MSKQDTLVAEIGIKDFSSSFERAVSRVCEDKGMLPIDLAVRERDEVPLNKVLIYADPKNWGRVILLHNPEDYEAVHARLKECDMRMHTIEPNPEYKEAGA